jgi:hypothetical protein
VSERLGDLPDGWADLEREDTASLAPPAGAKERVQAHVAVTLGLGAGFIAATAATSTAAAAATATAAAGATTAAAGTGSTGGAGAAATGLAGTLLAKKALVLGVAAAVGVGGGTAAYLEVRREQTRSRPAAVAPPPPVRAPVPLPVAPPPPEPPAEEPPAAEDTLGEERALLDRARLDIVHGKLHEARGLLAQHGEQFPGGQLGEEREALVIRLLVREGREAEARSRAARFRKEHPHSIQLPGIADALREHR